MINFQFFPRSHGVTPRIREIIECFKAVDKEKDASVHLKSNDMLALLRPHLEQIGFIVETGKAKDEQIFVPVLFSENDEVDKVEINMSSPILEGLKIPTTIDKNPIIDEPITEKVLNAMLEGKQVERKDQKTAMDDWASNIGYIYDINFKPSFKILKEKEYINKIINRTKTPEMEKIRNYVNKYIDEKI